MPFIFGLFYGIYGITGCCIGALISGLFLNSALKEILFECWCIFITGMIMYYGWHIQSKTHRITFKRVRLIARYIFLAGIGSIMCIRSEYMFSYFLTGMLIALPVNIFFAGLLHIEPIVPIWSKFLYDIEFELDSSKDSFEKASEILESSAESKGVILKRILETQSCLEELSIRIFKAIPDAVVKVKIIYYDAISMRLEYEGKRYNPFIIDKSEDILDIMGLKIIKHRALRASFFYYDKNNEIHVVI